MARIYRRKSLIKNTNPIVKEKKRKRNLIMNFRVSEEEKEAIENRIALSGLKKQDFFIQSCMHQKIVTIGNVKTFDEMKNKMKLVDQHLLELAEVDELEMDKLELLRTILEILDGLEWEEA